MANGGLFKFSSGSSADKLTGAKVKRWFSFAEN